MTDADGVIRTPRKRVPITERIESSIKNLEKEMLEKINNLGIGPQGFGGNTTALSVNIETFPTHIAGLPVVVNINCHSARHKQVII